MSDYPFVITVFWAIGVNVSAMAAVYAAIVAVDVSVRRLRRWARTRKATS
ncbi:hypothetical protein [Actinomadura sp. HBU206391]|nr:hypothetical protein [Actinomadura sp. HBU206391]MBC6458400.1 hypothetical protein [Actinomadura sp. HBU206391]